MEITNLFNTLNKFEDIENLISAKIRESEVLEYKGASKKFLDKDKNEIAKDVSAMANSNGGVIIYGIDTDKEDKTKPIGISGVHPDNIESFDRVVNSQIKREIKGVQKRIISKNSMKVMIVFVPQSDDSPHQSLIDKRYYRRSLSESIPMEHDIVELHFGRRLGPILKLEVIDVDKRIDKKIESLSFKGDNFSEPLKLGLSIYNSGRKVGKYVEGIFLFPESSKIKIINSDRLQNIDELYTHRGRQARQISENIGVFHPFMHKKIADITIEILKDWFEQNSFDEPLIEWRIFADEMTPRGESIYLRSKSHKT